MTGIYKSQEGQKLVMERYRELLEHWPVAYSEIRIPTREGETFAIASGEESAPPVLLMHGSLANAASWIGNMALWAQHFRVYAIDMIGEPGFSAPSRPPLATDAYVDWLDDVLVGLGLEQTALVGISLGGWLAVDYATHRPERVSAMALISPGGIGKQKVGILFKMIFFSVLGNWGRRKLRETILGQLSFDVTPNAKRLLGLLDAIHRHVRPRMEKLPVAGDAALKRLTMPVLTILGAGDVLLDSADTRRRIETITGNAKIVYIEDAGHYPPGQTSVIAEFLKSIYAKKQEHRN